MNLSKQQRKIYSFLDSRYPDWVRVYDMVYQTGVLQYNRVIKELREIGRKEGFYIENKTESVNGSKHSWYALVDYRPRVGADSKQQLLPVS